MKQLIGVSGTLCAGKDTAARYLADRYGYMHVSTGDVLRSEATRQGKDHERVTLIEIAVQLRKAQGNMGALIHAALHQWRAKQADFPDGLVISGLRVLAEAEELKRLGGILLFLDAPVVMRYERLRQRHRDGEMIRNLQDFIAYEQTEMDGSGGSERPYLRGISSIADIVLQNAGSEALLYAALDQKLRVY